jgi:hypothetical protein
MGFKNIDLDKCLSKNEIRKYFDEDKDKMDSILEELDFGTTFNRILSILEAIRPSSEF